METRSSYATRLVVGVLLVLEALVLQVVGAYAALVGGFLAVLSFGITGASVTDELLTKSALLIVLTLASPFVVGAVLGAGGAFVLVRRRRRVIMGAGLIGIVAQLGFHLVASEGFHPAELLPFAVNLLTVVVGFALVPTVPPAASNTTT